MEKTSTTQLTKQEKEQLFRALWSVADVLRGAMTADNFRDYMLSLLFFTVSIIPKSTEFVKHFIVFLLFVVRFHRTGLLLPPKHSANRCFPSWE